MDSDITSFLTVVEAYWTGYQTQMKVRVIEKAAQFQPSVLGWFVRASNCFDFRVLMHLVPAGIVTAHPQVGGRYYVCQCHVLSLGKGPGNWTLGDSELL